MNNVNVCMPRQSIGRVLDIIGQHQTPVQVSMYLIIVEMKQQQQQQQYQRKNKMINCLVIGTIDDDENRLSKRHTNHQSERVSE